MLEPAAAPHAPAGGPFIFSPSARGRRSKDPETLLVQGEVCHML